MARCHSGPAVNVDASQQERLEISQLVLCVTWTSSISELLWVWFLSRYQMKWWFQRVRTVALCHFTSPLNFPPNNYWSMLLLLHLIWFHSKHQYLSPKMLKRLTKGKMNVSLELPFDQQGSLKISATWIVNEKLSSNWIFLFIMQH